MDGKKTDLLLNLDKLHTTGLGAERIKRNLGCEAADAVDCCRQLITAPDAFVTGKGKNLYACSNGCLVTINASSFTIITAHRTKI